MGMRRAGCGVKPIGVARQGSALAGRRPAGYEGAGEAGVTSGVTWTSSGVPSGWQWR